MHDAARAALIAFDAAIDLEVVRTHGGLISAFSLYLVKPGRISVELGRALNRVEEIRLTADYKIESIDQQQARWAVEQAESFVRQVLIEFPTIAPDTGGN